MGSFGDETFMGRSLTWSDLWKLNRSRDHLETRPVQCQPKVVAAVYVYMCFYRSSCKILFLARTVVSNISFFTADLFVKARIYLLMVR